MQHSYFLRFLSNQTQSKKTNKISVIKKNATLLFLAFSWQPNTVLKKKEIAVIKKEKEKCIALISCVFLATKQSTKTK